MQTSHSSVSSEPEGSCSSSVFGDLRRRRQRPGISEGLPVRVLPGLGVGSAVGEEEGHADQRRRRRAAASGEESETLRRTCSRESCEGMRPMPCWPSAWSSCTRPPWMTGRGSRRSAGRRPRRRRGRWPSAPRTRPGPGRARSRARPCRRPRAGPRARNRPAARSPRVPHCPGLYPPRPGCPGYSARTVAGGRRSRDDRPLAAAAADALPRLAPRRRRRPSACSCGSRRRGHRRDRRIGNAEGPGVVGADRPGAAGGRKVGLIHEGNRDRSLGAA